MAITQKAAAPSGRRKLTLVGRGQRPSDRESAIKRAREARRQMMARHERFAHLKRVYD